MLPVWAERYFETVFGFPETEYAATKQALLSLCSFERRNGRERCLFRTSRAPSDALTTAAHATETVSSGWHYTPSVQELREETQRSLARFESQHPGYLARLRAHLDSAVHFPSDLPVDVPRTCIKDVRLAHIIGVSSELHVQNPGSVFQAASQFNLLEFISSSVTPEEGIAGYVHDATQGPDCAVACFPGTAYRNYLLHPDFVREGVLQMTGEQPPADAQRGQRADWQVDTLRDVTQFLTMARQGGAGTGRADLPAAPASALYRIQNGYFFASPAAEDDLAARLSAIATFFERPVEAVLEQMSSLLRIGVVEDTSVSHELMRDGACPAATRSGSPFPVVWQTFNSALSLTGRGREEAPGVRMLARCVLNGTYEATLLTGVQRTLRFLDEVCASPAGEKVLPDRLPPVFLTKVGGGVFHNEPAWITAALRKAMSRVAELGVPLDLRLVHFRRLDSEYLPSAEE